MTPKQISEQLIALHTAIVEKTGEQPWLEPKLEIEQDGQCSIDIYMGYKARADVCDRYGTAKSTTFAGVFKEAWHVVDNIPDHDTVAKRKFQKNLANVIDEGNGLNMPTEVMQPLSDGMTALSENLLTHQPEATS